MAAWIRSSYKISPFVVHDAVEVVMYSDRLIPYYVSELISNCYAVMQVDYLVI